MADQKYPSQLAERFQIRMPDGLRDRLRIAAEENKRSMNAEIIARLESTFPRIAYEPDLPERLGETHDDIVARHIGSYRAVIDGLYDQFEQAMKAELDAYYAGHVAQLKQKADPE